MNNSMHFHFVCLIFLKDYFKTTHHSMSPPVMLGVIAYSTVSLFYGTNPYPTSLLLKELKENEISINKMKNEIIAALKNVNSIIFSFQSF